MSKCITIRDYLNPPEGQIDAGAWQQLLQQGVADAMEQALECALRGDSASLAALCEQVLGNPGQARRLRDFHAPWLLAWRPDFMALDADIWMDAADGAGLLPLCEREYRNVRLERLVALCLSRPVRDGQVLQPRDINSDDTGWHEGCLVPQQPSLSASQARLLQAAVTLFLQDGKLPKVTFGTEGLGIQRLFAAVNAVLTCTAQVWAAFEAAGVDIDALLNTRVLRHRGGRDAIEEYLEVSLLRGGNPAAALAVARRVLTGEEQEGRRAEFMQVLTGTGNRCPHLDGRSQIVQLLEVLSHLDDEKIDHDPVFKALVGLCRLLHQGTGIEKLRTSLTLVGAHLQEVLERGDVQGWQRGWCAPFVAAVMAPVSQMEGRYLRQALCSLAAAWPPFHEAIDSIFRSACVPALRALRQGLPLLLSGGEAQGPGPRIDRWASLVCNPLWSRHERPARWRQLLKLLESAELDVTSTIAGFDHASPDGGRCSRHRTTLLHLVARYDYEPVAQHMAILLEMGADPLALDSNGRQPHELMLDDRAIRSWQALVCGERLVCEVA